MAGPPASSADEAPVSPSTRLAGQRDVLQTGVGILIVLVSVLSAVITWRAAETSARASDYDAQARQEQLLRDQHLSMHEADVGYDKRLFVAYSGHIRQAESLEREAAVSSPGEALALTRRAQEERAVTRSLHQLFLAQTPYGRPGRIAYAEREALNVAKAMDDDLNELHPDQLTEKTDQTRSKWLHLVAVDTGFIAALFLLTLSQLLYSRERRPRVLSRWLAQAGLLLAVGAVVAFVVVGW